jgi:hypothetical protein
MAEKATSRELIVVTTDTIESAMPGGIDTGIATTTQLPVFYRFSR